MREEIRYSGSVWFTELSESIIVGDRPRPKPKENEKENNTHTHTSIDRWQPKHSTEFEVKVRTATTQQHQLYKIMSNTRWRWFVSFIEFFNHNNNNNNITAVIDISLFYEKVLFPQQHSEYTALFTFSLFVLCMYLYICLFVCLSVGRLCVVVTSAAQNVALLSFLSMWLGASSASSYFSICVPILVSIWEGSLASNAVFFLYFFDLQAFATACHLLIYLKFNFKSGNIHECDKSQIKCISSTKCDACHAWYGHNTN